MNADFRHFETLDALHGEVFALLLSEFQSAGTKPYGVMLAGGSTPFRVYNQLAETEMQANPNLHIIFSDERHVPVDAPANNYGRCRPMLDNLGIAAERVIHVHTELELEAAAARYAADLAAFFDQGGTISLGLLGLGADGHTASIFTVRAAAIRDRLAFPVAATVLRRPAGHGPGDTQTDETFFSPLARVSVSALVLERVARLIFVVSGDSKRPILYYFNHHPLNLPAGMATENCEKVEIWTDIPAIDL